MMNLIVYRLFLPLLHIESKIATDQEQATGLEKKELDAQLAGEEVHNLRCIKWWCFDLMLCRMLLRIHSACPFTRLFGVQKTSRQ